MKKNLITVFIVWVVLLPMLVHAKHKLKLVPGVKVGPGIWTITNAVEYERRLMPFTTGFLKWSGGEFDVIGNTQVTMALSSIGIGVRYNLVLVRLGIGLEATRLTIANDHINGRATGRMVGPMVEISKHMGLGPISVGGGVSLHVLQNKVSFNHGAPFDLGNFKPSHGMGVISAECYVGYSF